ncbi:MAG: hypothetical protein WD044_01045 [Dongiaceae bacterium]
MQSERRCTGLCAGKRAVYRYQPSVPEIDGLVGKRSQNALQASFDDGVASECGEINAQRRRRARLADDIVVLRPATGDEIELVPKEALLGEAPCHESGRQSGGRFRVDPVCGLKEYFVLLGPEILDRRKGRQDDVGGLRSGGVRFTQKRETDREGNEKAGPAMHEDPPVVLSVVAMCR